MLRPNAGPGVHQKVLELLGEERRGRVLDAPAGEGALSKALSDIGFTVSALDINGRVFKAHGANIDFKTGDLNGAIEYPDSSFDYAICVEGIEHLENPHHLARELARVLRPQGKLVVTTPNIASIASRIKFLLFGSYRYFNSRIDIADKSLRAHINPVGFPELELILNETGFMVETITANNARERTPFLLRPIAHILRWANTHFNRAYNEMLLHPALLFGDILIIKARKA
ncbi:MAG: class I SAM-dependent methyltransferase [Candidatus Omnitrophica bacterium]|nr:class I SAM-dependent methyltransferase [Candidatus Omnitrophota bacterium]